MRLLDINKVNIDFEKISEINRKRNALYRKILFDPNNKINLFNLFVAKMQTLAEIMNIKNAQAEASSVEEAKQYLENLKKAYNYTTQKIADNEDFAKHHEIICLHSMLDPEGHLKHPGSYRKTLVKVGTHWAPEPERVFSLMDNLFYQLQQIRSPIVKAIYAHHEIVRIHPFVDGNGRVARLIMNWILMYDLLPPIFIKTIDCRKNYIVDLSNSFNFLSNHPYKHNDATDKFFDDEINRVANSVQFIIVALFNEHL